MPHSKKFSEMDRPRGSAVWRLNRWQACQDIGRIIYYSGGTIEQINAMKTFLGADLTRVDNLLMAYFNAEEVN